MSPTTVIVASMRVKLIATRNRVDGKFRTAISLRLQHPPGDVEYEVFEGYPRLPPTFNGYERSWRTAINWTLRFATQPLIPVRGEVVHSFFLDNLYIPRGKWVTELDQPISTFFTEYAKLSGLSKRVGELLFRTLNRRAVVVTWTEWSADGLKADGLEDVRIIPPPMETGFRRPHSKSTILFVGLDYDRKGGEVAEHVFLSIGKEHRKIWIGQPRRRLKDVEYVNPLPRERLRELLMETDVLLFPSQVEAYGFTMLEAMSVGVPVVSSDYGSLPETLQGGGELCERRDVRCFLESSKELLDSPELNRKLGSAGRRVVESRHSPGEVGRKLAELYTSLAE
ncbi:glycosyl transferase family 1 [Sulfodiicoccus acidiphilus]|uniref:Glycosyl transferase family 1 n=1 Tax=Sulfodiicoccus acidiphilus TaxID=1670455 RepID=A0A348B1N0_9CREN|nr:glycosyltransferase family 4 protein [Sulfodiicoccus acidiphilus]BBD72082.1 glycosyl transferase family 1 [Sulfodiicoccus acidiphilus]GGU05019.1 glycosyl transferase family 1 [Sulfodiicoccus acidiphilus]